MTTIPADQIPLAALDGCDARPDIHCTEACRRGWRVLAEINAGLEADVERLTMGLAARRRVVEVARLVFRELPPVHAAALRDALDAVTDADRAGWTER